MSGNVHFSSCLRASRFISIDEEGDFETGKLRCAELGATLARISSFDENDFVGEFLNSLADLDENASFWIGTAHTSCTVS